MSKKKEPEIYGRRIVITHTRKGARVSEWCSPRERVGSLAMRIAAEVKLWVDDLDNEFLDGDVITITAQFP